MAAAVGGTRAGTAQLSSIGSVCSWSSRQAQQLSGRCSTAGSSFRAAGAQELQAQQGRQHTGACDTADTVA